MLHLVVYEQEGDTLDNWSSVVGRGEVMLEGTPGKCVITWLRSGLQRIR
jgi:hypothetical protein